MRTAGMRAMRLTTGGSGDPSLVFIVEIVRTVVTAAWRSSGSDRSRPSRTARPRPSRHRVQERCERRHLGRTPLRCHRPSRCASGRRARSRGAVWQLSVLAIGFTCCDQRQPGSNTPRPTGPESRLTICAAPLSSANGRTSSGVSSFLISSPAMRTLPSRVVRAVVSHPCSSCNPRLILKRVLTWSKRSRGDARRRGCPLGLEQRIVRSSDGGSD